MNKSGLAIVAIILTLPACSASDDQSSSEKVAATSSAPDSAAETVTPKSSPQPRLSSASDATATATPTASSPTETSEPTPEPEQVTDPCAPDTLSNDLLGYSGGIGIFTCESGWAYAYYVGGDGDAEFVAQHQGGQWVNVAGMGSMTCREELTETGAPPAVVRDFLPCDEMYPSDEDAAPVDDCVIPTEQYGATFAEPLRNVSCDEAANQWYSASENSPPSFESPITNANGWECYVYPNDPSSRVAGACYSPDGSAEFVLNLPG